MARVLSWAWFQRPPAFLMANVRAPDLPPTRLSPLWVAPLYLPPQSRRLPSPSPFLTPAAQVRNPQRISQVTLRTEATCLRQKMAEALMIPQSGHSRS